MVVKWSFLLVLNLKKTPMINVRSSTFNQPLLPIWFFSRILQGLFNEIDVLFLQSNQNWSSDCHWIYAFWTSYCFFDKMTGRFFFALEVCKLLFMALWTTESFEESFAGYAGVVWGQAWRSIIWCCVIRKFRALLALCIWEHTGVWGTIVIAT